MANELKHASVGTELTQSEYEQIDGHVLDGQAAGDVIYAASSSSLQRLAIGATDDFFTVQGGLPIWSKAFDPVFVIGGDNATSRVLRLRKSRGTVAAPTVVVSGDNLGDFSFDGYDGDSWVQAAVIRAVSEGTIAGARMPAKLSLLVNTDAAPSVLTERLSIDSAGLISLPTATATAGALRFGTDTQLYAAANKILRVTDASDVTATIQAKEFSIVQSGFGVSWFQNTNAGYFLTSTSLILGTGAANGQRVNIKHLTELTTIAAAATTDTAIQIPINAVVFAVSVRVTTVIPTAATFTVTGATSGTQFDRAGGVAVAAGTTDVGTALCPYANGAAQAIRITPNIQPGDNTGRVRVTIYYYDITPATS